jgi:hypothetical protein
MGAVSNKNSEMSISFTLKPVCVVLKKIIEAVNNDAIPSVVAFVGPWRRIKKSGIFTNPIEPTSTKAPPINNNIEIINSIIT